MSNHVILHVSTRFYTFFVEDQQITTLKKEKKNVKKQDFVSTPLCCYIRTNIMINVLNFKHSTFFIVVLLYAQIPRESTSLAPTFFVFTCNCKQMK